MKTAVSVPDRVFEEGERLAARLGWSRSQLYATALERFLESTADDDDPVTAALDALADDMGGTVTVNSGRALIDAGLWQW